MIFIVLYGPALCQQHVVSFLRTLTVQIFKYRILIVKYVLFGAKLLKSDRMPECLAQK